MSRLTPSNLDKPLHSPPRAMVEFPGNTTGFQRGREGDTLVFKARGTPKARVFICYSRSNALHAAARLRQSFQERLPDAEIFRDVESTRGSTNWKVAINQALGQGVAVLALVDENWVAIRKERHDKNQDDWIRTELEIALGHQANVIPVPLENAKMPTEAQLPPSIRNFALIDATRLTDDYWDEGVERLQGRIVDPKPASSWRPWAIVVPAMAAVAALVLWMAPTPLPEPLLDPIPPYQCAADFDGFNDLFKRLQDGKSDIRRAARVELAQKGPDAVPRILCQMDNDLKRTATNAYLVQLGVCNALNNMGSGEETLRKIAATLTAGHMKGFAAFKEPAMQGCVEDLKKKLATVRPQR